MNNISKSDLTLSNDNLIDRKILPFRKKTELILLNDHWNLLVEDHWSYLMFPGWWIDQWEIDIRKSAERELYEETWLIIDWDLKYLWNVSWKWFPEWANNEKRKKRYMEFQWEESYFYLWKAKLAEKVDLLDEDSWKNLEWIPLRDAIEKLVYLANNDHPNTYPYRIAQLNWLRVLAIINNIKIPEEQLSILNRM